jgi:hypothetical protein
MRRLIPLLAIVLAGSAVAAADEKPAPFALKVPAPEFTGIEAWINSKPLDWKSLRGKVVAVHFWAFG